MSCDFLVSDGDHKPQSASRLGRDVAPSEWSFGGGRLLLHGNYNPAIAALAHYLLGQDRQVVLWPYEVDSGDLPFATSGHLGLYRGREAALMRSPSLHAREEADEWAVGLLTSGSTGLAKAFAFDATDLESVARWYQAIYSLTARSVVVTAMPVTYNFAFIAGVCVAREVGCRLHFPSSSLAVNSDATRLAREHDRCVVLANPMLLQEMAAGRPLPDNVLIDTGGAPLSVWAITYFREKIADLREGYGLTETASLTHFDAEGSDGSAGFVGTGMPGVKTEIVTISGRPLVALRSPVIGRRLERSGHVGPRREGLLTSDLGVLDSVGRLRVLGRSDDDEVGGFWPRDSLDAIGPLIGPACARVQHPRGSVDVLLNGRGNDRVTHSVSRQLATKLGISPSRIDVRFTQKGGLHSLKLPRRRVSDRAEGDK